MEGPALPPDDDAEAFALPPDDDAEAVAILPRLPSLPELPEDDCQSPPSKQKKVQRSIKKVQWSIEKAQRSTKPKGKLKVQRSTTKDIIGNASGIGTSRASTTVWAQQ